MNVEIGTKAAQFSEKEYINGIFVAMHIMTRQKEEKRPRTAKKTLYFLV